MGEMVDLTVEILKDIRAELRKTNERLDQLNQRTERVEARLERVEHGITQLNQRFDHLLEFAGDRYRDHEARIRALEAAAQHRDH